jgi:hypothetical protein
MIENRIKRVLMFVLILVPLVFGGLAAYQKHDSKAWQAIIQQLNTQTLELMTECEKLNPYEKQLNLCDSGTQWRRESAREAAQYYSDSREKFELYTSIAIYFPISTLALYFVARWIWIGKVANEEPDELQRKIWKHRKTIAISVAAIFGSVLSYWLWPERTTKIFISGVVQAILMVSVVWLIRKFYNQKK